MIRVTFTAFCCVAALTPRPVFAQESTQTLAAAPTVLPSYATVAGQVLAAPSIVDARIRSTIRLKGADAADLAAGHVRFYVEADVLALIRGANPLPARIGYVADVPLTASGRAPKLRKQRVLLFARPVPGRADQVQLIGTDAQREWSAPLDARVREITRQSIAADAPPAITGIGNAFHVPGSLPGEGETQVFLQTANNAPVSLQILRRPGETPRWSVSLGDIVDDSAGPPARDTLLWYRLACGLPRELPAHSLDSADAANAATAREDYAMVLRALGPCE